MATGKRLLPALFGSCEKAVTSGISRESGLPSGAIATLLSMAAPVVMSFISKRMRDGGMTMDGLASALQRESATIKSALPAGLSELFWPATATATAAATASPVVAQAVQREHSFNWLPIIAIAGLGLGLLWFLSHARRPSIDQVVPSTAVGTANRIAVPLPKTTCTVHREREAYRRTEPRPACWLSCGIPIRTRMPGSVWTRLHSIQDRPHSGLNRRRSSITLRRFYRVVRVSIWTSPALRTMWVRLSRIFASPRSGRAA